MTFQIGMLGSDGVLLASDTLYTHPGKLPGSRRTYNAKKILIREDEAMAYCSSGDDVSAKAAELHSNSTTVEIYQSMVMSRTTAIEKYSTIENKNGNHGTVLAAHRTATGVELWYMDVSSQAQLPISIPSHICAGDQQNPAAFLIERYFPKDRRLPIRDLIFLAAHTVLMASKFSSGVGGLQILLGRPAGFEALSDEDISALKERSRKLDAEITASLGLPLT